MTKTIKVTTFANEGMKVEEVTFAEAKRIVEEANSKGRLVVNKQKGEVIDEIAPDVNEIMVIAAAGGG